MAEQNQIECIIYRNPDIFLGRHILDGSIDSYTVGTSEYCNISLSEFKNDLQNVKDTHLAIVRKENSWVAINPNDEGELKDISGNPISALRLSHGMKIFFGNCCMEFRTQRSSSPYSISFSSKHTPPQVFSLCNGDNLIGTTDDSEIRPEGVSDKIKILSVNTDGDIPVIVPLCDEIETSTHKKLTRKSLADSYERYIFRDLEFEILKSGASVQNPPGIERLKSGIIGFFIVIMLIVNLILIGTLFTGGRMSKASPPPAPPSPQELVKQASDNMQKGEILLAMKSIAPISKSDSSYYKELHEALALELNFSELLDFHERKLNAIGTFLIDPLPDSAIPDPVSNLKLYSLYLSAARSEIEDAIAKTSKYECRQLDIKSSSMFLKRAPSTMEKIKIFQDLFEKSISLNKACGNEEWEKAIEILNDLRESFKKNKLDSLLVKCDELLMVVETSQKIDEIEDQVAVTDFIEKSSSENYLTRLSSLNENISTIAKYDPDTASDLDEFLQKTKETINLAGKVRDDFISWKKDPGNIAALEHLVKSLSSMNPKDNPEGKTPPTIDHVVREIRKFISENIANLPEDITPEALKKCNQAESLLLTVSPLRAEFNNEAIYDKIEKITKGLNKKCATLYTRYEAIMNESPAEAENILKEIFENAPPDSRYAKWAENEMRKRK